jgi:Family of unknown function (DUF6220)
MRWMYAVLAWLTLGAVIVQFFLAGLGVFAGFSNFEAHQMLGYTLLFVMLLDFFVALAARLPWRLIGLAALLPVLVLLQSIFVELWHDGATTVAALHVINGLAIFSFSGFLATRAPRYIGAQQPSANVAVSAH